MNSELQTIPIARLYESPENSRHVFDDRKLKELAQSIQAQGIKVRLIVRQSEAGKFEIVAGARRYPAAQPLPPRNDRWDQKRPEAARVKST